MKQRMSIKARITLWYAVLLIVICMTAFVVMIASSERSTQTYYRDTLHSASVVIIDEMEVEHGLLEIDDDIDEVPNVYASLFDLEGGLIYGRRRVEADFENGCVRQVHAGEHSWYILDTLIDLQNREDIWLRVYMSSDISMGMVRSLAVSGAWLLVPLAALALLGGYAVTAGAFRPVKELSELAGSIAGGGDLSRRVQTAGNRADELHALAETFNGMLQRLEEAFVRESRFVSDAAHELRTPLNAVRTQGEYALSRTDTQQKDEAIGMILEKNEQMRQMIDQMLMLARMDAGRIPMEDECDLAGMIGEIREEMEIVALEKDVHLLAALTPCTVRGNRSMLMRAAINLVDNAIRYGKKGGSVKLTVEREEGFAVIAVQDDGPGMTKEEQAHAFERFWRADSARHAGGTGIGLAIVQAAAHAHGGEAAVESEPGKGCRFTIRIPV